MLVQHAVATDDTNLDACPADIEPTHRPELVYPGLSAGGGRQAGGSVTVEFTISEDGTTTDVRLVSSTNSIYERPALRTVLKYRYAPRPQSCIYQLQLDYEDWIQDRTE